MGGRMHGYMKEWAREKHWIVRRGRVGWEGEKQTQMKYFAGLRKENTEQKLLNKLDVDKMRKTIDLSQRFCHLALNNMYLNCDVGFPRQ